MNAMNVSKMAPVKTVSINVYLKVSGLTPFVHLGVEEFFHFMHCADECVSFIIDSLVKSLINSITFRLLPRFLLLPNK